VANAQLDDDERGERQDRTDQQRERERRSPAVCAGDREPVNQQEQAGRDRECPRES